MIGHFGDGDLQEAVLCRYCIGRIPFEVSGGPVVQVDSFPVGVVAWVKRPSIGVEFVGKDEVVYIAI